ncbi:DUF397 domain-containing protein [Streptomyces sp. NPDC127079]|uniref:DUF397 domain-containing protein n=1 Tax=Streptomyces sp. NPDC127079 TaxID=3347132 RepID=UPI0036592F2A
MTLKASEAGAKVEWIKSSYSTADGPDCIEAAAVPDHILVRDSKNPDGPRLTLAPAVWVTFRTSATQR